MSEYRPLSRNYYDIVGGTPFAMQSSVKIMKPAPAPKPKQVSKIPPVSIKLKTIKKDYMSILMVLIDNIIEF